MIFSNELFTLDIANNKWGDQAPEHRITPQEEECIAHSKNKELEGNMMAFHEDHITSIENGGKDSSKDNVFPLVPEKAHCNDAHTYIRKMFKHPLHPPFKTRVW
jgi:hypothetical protein